MYPWQLVLIQMALMVILQHNLQVRRALRRERRYRRRLDPFAFSEQHLLSTIGFSGGSYCTGAKDWNHLLDEQRGGTHAVLCHMQVLIAVTFYVSGSFQSVLADTFGVVQSYVSSDINWVTNRLYRISLREIKMPRGKQGRFLANIC